jgi:hypothetical protein
MWRRALVALLAVGCGKHLNPAWCAQPGHSDPACPEQAMVDAGPGMCPDDASCPTACQGANCPDPVCLPSGECVADSTVLFAATDGTGTACSRSAACSLATAIDQATADRKIIALAAGIYRGAVAITHAVQIVGDGATLQAAATGPAVTVTNDISAELDGVAITGAASDSGVSCIAGTLRLHGVTIRDNAAIGITSACDLTLEASTLTHDDGGAMEITSGSIDIRNNFIVQNGAPTLGKTANVILHDGVTGTFDFNTVAYNDSKANGNPGIECDSAQLFAIGNLVTDNTHKGQFNVPTQVAGACDFSRSYVMPGAGANDLHWVNTTTDFHLTKDSTAVIDRPELACDGILDFDGQARPLGAGCDYGADEFAP